MTKRQPTPMPARRPKRSEIGPPKKKPAMMAPTVYAVLTAPISLGLGLLFQETQSEEPWTALYTDALMDMNLSCWQGCWDFLLVSVEDHTGRCHQAVDPVHDSRVVSHDERSVQVNVGTNVWGLYRKDRVGQGVSPKDQGRAVFQVTSRSLWGSIPYDSQLPVHFPPKPAILRMSNSCPRSADQASSNYYSLVDTSLRWLVFTVIRSCDHLQ